MAHCTRPPAAPPADKVPASDLWPGMKSVRVSEQARPILEGLQADAVAEAGRLTQKRGVQTDAETAAKAGKLIQDGTFTLDHILEAKPGTTWNAEEGHAAISILQALGNRVAKLAEMSLKESSGVSPERSRRRMSGPGVGWPLGSSCPAPPVTSARSNRRGIRMSGRPICGARADGSIPTGSSAGFRIRSA